jgi:hypothetical protein
LSRDFFKYPDTPAAHLWFWIFFPNSQNQWLFKKFKYPPKFGQDPPNQKEIGPREKKKDNIKPPNNNGNHCHKDFCFLLGWDFNFYWPYWPTKAQGYYCVLDLL